MHKSVKILRSEEFVSRDYFTFPETHGMHA